MPTICAILTIFAKRAAIAISTIAAKLTLLTVNTTPAKCGFNTIVAKHASHLITFV
jgi:hypothetical protein